MTQYELAYRLIAGIILIESVSHVVLFLIINGTGAEISVGPVKIRFKAKGKSKKA